MINSQLYYHPSSISLSRLQALTMASSSLGEEASLIHEVKNKKVIPQKGDQPATTRIARYIKPIADNSSNPPAPIPNTPLLSEIFPHDIEDWPARVIFKGWNSPQRRWREWVESLIEKHGAVWEQTGICDAIAASVYEVGFNSDLLLGLAEFWCPETNTFVFPWGEGGLTLEDMAVLGGFPVVGKEIAGVSLSEEMGRMVEEMEKHRVEICRSRAKKASHSEWLKLFMGEDFRGSALEHVAFLSLWLSRFVFPPIAEEVIGRHVFPIAAALSKGEQMAIAPAVLANLYKDLTELKEKALDSDMICVSAPFQFLTLWAFEHFPAIGPTPISLLPGEPRIARWNNLNWEITLPLIRSALQVSKNFKWRPYSADYWHHCSYYKETGQSFCYSSTLHVELRSFFQCLKSSELVSIDGHKEKYLPNRVAMQFGMDQDIPSDLSGLKFTSENVRFFVPPKSFTPGVSRRYMEWWKDMMVNRESLIKDMVVQRRNELTSKVSSGSSTSKSCGEKEQTDSDSWDDDNVPIAILLNLHCDVSKTTSSSHQEFTCTQSHNVTSSTSKTASENSQKRKLPTTPQGVSAEQVAKKPTKGVMKEVKTEAGEVGCSINKPIEVDETGVVKRRKIGREMEGETQRKVGESLDNPIDLDNYMDIDTCGCQKGGID